jgi:ferredoxin
MADVKNKVPENAPGMYFVDDSCIDCDTCRCISPVNFRRSDEHGYSYVYRQPATGEERELVEEATECCPVGAIGTDETLAQPIAAVNITGSASVDIAIAEVARAK